jgi:hypothetical protein
MLQRFRDQVGTAGLIVAVVALVLALGGGAYAASGALTGKQKKEVEKIAKKYAGKPGTAGATGPAGAAGAKGDTGAAGAAGAEGKQGIQGKEGKEGAEGLEGSPWTAGGTLPVGSTETGVWTLYGGSTASEVASPISFPIPLAAGLSGTKVHFAPGLGEGPTGTCTGNVSNPTAPSGTLCVYNAHLAPETAGPTFAGIYNATASAEGTSKSGALIFFTGVVAESEGYGSWAVTG